MFAMQPILRVQQLTKIYPGSGMRRTPSTAVDRISFELREGEVLGVLGPNGAGKSTTIAMLMDMLTPTSGDITVFGKPMKTHRKEIMQHVTFASTYVSMPWRLSVWENLRVASLLYGIRKAEFAQRAETLLKFFGVWEYRHKTLGMLSAGQVTRVILSKAFIPRPKIALLDEPTASLDPDIAHQVRTFVLEQQEKYGTSIVYTSHNMDEVAAVCDRVMFLKEGRVVAEDTPERLVQSMKTGHVRLTIQNPRQRETLIELARTNNLGVSVDEKEVEVSVDEQRIARFLQSVSEAGVMYQQIEIGKPTLEEYFLMIAQQ